MIYEKDIPEYALQPARDPDAAKPLMIEEVPVESAAVTPTAATAQIVPEPAAITPAAAVFSTVKITAAEDSLRHSIVIEEDVLVPDIRPDMSEILMMNGNARLSSREIQIRRDFDDPVILSGDVNLQTVYIPVSGETVMPAAINNTVHFRGEWPEVPRIQGTMMTSARVEKADYMIINERKFRVSLTVIVEGRIYTEKQIDVFERLADDEIEMLKEQVEVTDVALRKKDTISVSEMMYPKDSTSVPESILMQNLTITANYKQITGEKIVINGFVYCNLLYTTMEDKALQDKASQGEESKEQQACSAALQQYQGRVEFTQFIPINQSGPWSGSKVMFYDRNLMVSVESDGDGRTGFRLQGDIETDAELCRNIKNEMMTDGYHRKKEFSCRFETMKCNTLMGNGISETSVREIINIPDNTDMDRVLCCNASVRNTDCRIEQGKGIIEGILDGKMICRTEGDDGRIFSLSEEIPFRCTVDIPPAGSADKIEAHTYIKDVWADKINGKQIELNCTACASAEVMKETEIRILREPAFVTGEHQQNNCAMVISVVNPHDTLWGIAKKYKTTTEAIMALNDTDGALSPGQKLLIVRS